MPGGSVAEAASVAGSEASSHPALADITESSLPSAARKAVSETAAAAATTTAVPTAAELTTRAVKLAQVAPIAQRGFHPSMLFLFSVLSYISSVIRHAT